MPDEMRDSELLARLLNSLPSNLDSSDEGIKSGSGDNPLHARYIAHEKADTSRDIKPSRAIMRAAVIGELMQRGEDTRPFLDQHPSQADLDELQTMQSILTPSLYSDLMNKLQQYRKLRENEKRLREYVYLLAERVVHLGVLEASIDSVLELRHTQAQLNKQREELAHIEEELDHAIRDYYKTEPQLMQAERQIKRDHIEQLVIDIIRKRDQIRIYEDHIRFLEEQITKHGLNVPTNLFSKLQLTLRAQSRATRERIELENELKNKYLIESEIIQGIEYLDESKIAFLVEDMTLMYARKMHS
jgi:hypothetical protein